MNTRQTLERGKRREERKMLRRTSCCASRRFGRLSSLPVSPRCGGYSSSSSRFVFPWHYYNNVDHDGGIARRIVMYNSSRSFCGVATTATTRSTRTLSSPLPPRRRPASSQKTSSYKNTSTLARGETNAGGVDDDMLLTSSNSTSNHSNSTNTTKSYFDPEKSAAEWRVLTDQLLQTPIAVDDEDEDGAEEGTLLWMDIDTENSSSSTESNGDATTTRQELPPSIFQAIIYWSFQRSPQGVQLGFALYEHLCRAIFINVNAQYKVDVDVDNAWIHHWYDTGTARFPQSTHLLNALLDSWRICRQCVNHKHQQHHHQSSFSSSSTGAVPTPAQMWQRVQELAVTTDIPLNHRTYSLIMQAATADATAAAAILMDKRHHHHDNNNNSSHMSNSNIHTSSNNNNNNNNTSRRRRQYGRQGQAGRQEDRSHLRTGATTDDLMKVVETTPMFCEDLLQIMLDHGQSYPPALPDTIAFTTAMKAWAILGKTQQQQQHQQRHGGGGTVVSTASSSSSSCNDDDLPPQRALQLLRRMQQLYQNRTNESQPNTITYNTLLEVLTNSGQVERAEEILRREMMMTMPSAASDGAAIQQLAHHCASPDTVSFRIVIYGWAAYFQTHPRRPPHHRLSSPQERRDGEQQGVKMDWFDRAYTLLKEMHNWQLRQVEDEHSSVAPGGGMMMVDSIGNSTISNHAKVQVDTSFYSRLISSLAKDGQYKRAEGLYLEMQDRFGGSVIEEKGNKESISSTITMSAQQQEQQGEVVQGPLLLQFQDDCRAKRAMIVVYAKTNRPHQAERMLKDLEQHIKEHAGGQQWLHQSALVGTLAPKESHYRDVIDSWATSTGNNSIDVCKKSRSQHVDGNNDENEGLDRGEQLLLRMMDKSMLAGRPELTPSVELIDRVLCNWIDTRNGSNNNSSFTDCCYRAETLLRLLEERLAAMAGGGGGGQGQLALFRVLQQGRPLFFGRVIHAWSQCTLFDAPERAESLLWEMQQKCDEESIECAHSHRNNHQADGSIHAASLRPTRFHYCSVVTAWGQSGRADAAENAKEIFAVALDQYQMGHQVAQPDTFLYLAVIRACARARDANGVKQYTQQLLDECQRQTGENGDKNSLLHTTTMTLNSILLDIVHCSSSKVSRRAASLSYPEMALHFFEKMNQQLQVQPDARSFQLLAEILSSSEKKETYASKIEECLDQARRLAAKETV